MPEVVRNIGTAASRVLADAMAKAEVVQVEGLTLPTVTPIVGEAISRSLVERAGQPVRTVSPALVGRLKKLPKRVVTDGGKARGRGSSTGAPVGRSPASPPSKRPTAGSASTSGSPRSS